MYHHMVFCLFVANTRLMPVKRAEAVLLRGDSIGVTTETKPRKVQRNGRDNSYKVSLNRDWLQQLNLDDQGAHTVHSVSVGRKPVIVQNPAIIIQPASVIGDGGHD